MLGEDLQHTSSEDEVLLDDVFLQPSISKKPADIVLPVMLVLIAVGFVLQDVYGDNTVKNIHLPANVGRLDTDRTQYTISVLCAVVGSAQGLLLWLEERLKRFKSLHVETVS